MKALVAGWFSFSHGHATAGDLLTRDLTCDWLLRAGYSFDVAVAPPFDDGVDWRKVNPRNYTVVVFVCGPFAKGELEAEFLDRFRQCRMVGLNLSMQVPLHRWNPFDLLIERDSSRRAHADMVFGTTQPKVPVVGLCLVETYEGALVAGANQAIQRLVELKSMAVVHIDTRLDINSTALRTPAEIESIIARMDVLVTTRLHGMVLALKNGVPVVAIDPEQGGAKIVRQAQTIGWPLVFTADKVSDEELRNAFEYCLTEEALTLARACGESARNKVHAYGEEFMAALSDMREVETNYKVRMMALQSGIGADKYRIQPTAGENSHPSIRQRLMQWMEKMVNGFRTLGEWYHER